MNHLISEELPSDRDDEHLSNSDPITGQAGWYDVRVRIYPAAAGEPKQTWPQFDGVSGVPGQCEGRSRGKWLTYFAGSVRKSGDRS